MTVPATSDRAPRSPAAQRLPIDITFHCATHAGIKSSREVRKYLEGSMMEAVPLTLILKHLLVKRDMHRPFRGGLSSYALTLMVIVLVQLCRQEVRHVQQQHAQKMKTRQQQQAAAGSPAAPDDPLPPLPGYILDAATNTLKADHGFLLMRFLDFYGRRFNPRITGLSVVRGPFTMKGGSADPITIEDPLDRSNNVARSTFGIVQVQCMFAQTCTLLETRGMEILRQQPDADLLELVLAA